MVLECYHYKYNDTVTASCSGSFKDCARLVKCNGDDSGSTSNCFALARLDEGNNNTVILSGGCYPSNLHIDCDKKCIGTQRKTGNFYCCCTENGCNGNLIPNITPSSLTNSNQVESPPPLPGISFSTNSQSEIIHNNRLPVIILIILALLTLGILSCVYLKRSRSKRRESISRYIQRSPTGDQRAGEPMMNNMNNRELDDMRNNSENPILTPFRNSFNEESNFHQYGQQRSHNANNHGDINNFINHNRASHNGANNFTTNNINQNRPQHQHVSSQIDLNRVRLLELIGSGRFGTVHKALLAPRKESSDENLKVGEDGVFQALEENEIAVKIIPNHEHQSWQNELMIYSSTRTRHPNILSFIGHTESPLTNSRWLLVEFASNGSLHHYLKSNTITWPDYLSIALGIVRGLSHLHDADIAHRDFKSKNVLLRQNLSPCITDFGVASMLDLTGGSQTEQRKKYLQVGTPRYMAPEVLECSVAFTKISFTKIDVYALSLVLWELLTRCYPLPKSHGYDYEDTLLSNVPNVLYSKTYEDRQNAQQAYQSPPVANPMLDRSSSPSQPNLSPNCSPRCPENNGLDTEEEDNGENNVKEKLLNSTNETSTMGRDEADCAVINLSSPNELDGTLSNQVCPYKMPFEDCVGPNPDINTMRQAVVSERIRPSIQPEWRFYPLSKICQAIVDGWEYDHDARISASCFVERLEILQQELFRQNKQQINESMNTETNASLVSAATTAVQS